MKNKPIENSLMLLGAAGLGVGLMYMLDPEHGKQRREALAQKAEHAISTTGEALGTTIHTASDSAKSVAKKISGYAHHLAENISDTAHEAVETGEHAAREHLSKAKHRIEEAHQHVVERAGSLWSRAKEATGMAPPPTHPIATATGITAATVSVLGLGAGLMYVLDPSKGRARRAWMRDKVTSITRQTGREARQYGRHLGNRMKGYVAQAKRSVPWQEEQSSMPQGSQSFGNSPR